ncbi:bifunctional 2-polyprenyl-6-hydroxyphenol methylase/3-demethylubiquinol 3-O-methyltransferase UbiG [Gammaproteobacteria bacterium]|nr:bifunctional 2-polyprenyl-6-hydroxyphenol methylase/3-demethylubiquinol 3-O-methyltransferase UbiG [Gammaproteobacteria bacterium]
MSDHTQNLNQNLDPTEVNKFNELASRWWDENSEFKPLHQINPLRVNYINERTSLAGKLVLDVGCGGGLLTEGMAAFEAQVTGIDLAPDSLEVARLHLLESGYSIDYQLIEAAQLKLSHSGHFDVVTCLEVLEHVPDPAELIRDCAAMLKPGGHLMLSTLNRNIKSFMGAIVGAEYLLGLVPKGTHDFERFIKPSEMNRWAQSAGVQLQDITGITYKPLSKTFALAPDIDINYLAHFRLPE